VAADLKLMAYFRTPAFADLWIDDCLADLDAICARQGGREVRRQLQSCVGTWGLAFTQRVLGRWFQHRLRRYRARERFVELRAWLAAEYPAGGVLPRWAGRRRGIIPRRELRRPCGPKNMPGHEGEQSRTNPRSAFREDKHDRSADQQQDAEDEHHGAARIRGRRRLTS
jgi:hypothetical protein